jgi:hypothetical protein
LEIIQLPTIIIEACVANFKLLVPRFRKGLQPTHRHGNATIKSVIQESKEMEQEKERETCVANFKLLVQRFRKGLQPTYRHGIVTIKSVSPEGKEMEQERETEVGWNEEGVLSMTWK